MLRFSYRSSCHLSYHPTSIEEANALPEYDVLLDDIVKKNMKRIVFVTNISILVISLKKENHIVCV